MICFYSLFGHDRGKLLSMWLEYEMEGNALGSFYDVVVAHYNAMNVQIKVSEPMFNDAMVVERKRALSLYFSQHVHMKGKDESQWLFSERVSKRCNTVGFEVIYFKLGHVLCSNSENKKREKRKAEQAEVVKMLETIVKMTQHVTTLVNAMNNEERV